jgi:hypothetical protein
MRSQFLNNVITNGDKRTPDVEDDPIVIPISSLFQSQACLCSQVVLQPS